MGEGVEHSAAQTRTQRAYEPSFARGYPNDPELERLVVAFTWGDFATVGRGCRELVDKSADPTVAAAARDLRSRIRPDPFAYVVLALTVVLIVSLSIFAWIRSREFDQAPRAPSSPAAAHTHR